MKRALTFVVATLLCAACSEADPQVPADRGGRDSGLQAPASDPGFLDLVPNAPFHVAYRGVRHVDLRYDGHTVEYREEVGSDGEGQFSVEVTDVLSAMPDPDLFRELQSARQIFTYRFRDWRIRDLALFQQNYLLTVEDTPTTVAGVTCARVQVQRDVALPRNRYVVDIDPATGLVMRWDEFDSAGTLLASVGFDTFELDADISDLFLTGRNFTQTTTHDLGDDLLTIFGFQPLIPTVLPDDGARLEPQIERMIVQSEVYAKVFLHDGLEVAVMMSRKPVASGMSASHVRFAEAGTWVVLDGQVEGYPVEVAGKYPVEALELMIASSF